jgi:Bacterial TSP3 repeat
MITKRINIFMKQNIVLVFAVLFILTPVFALADVIDFGNAMNPPNEVSVMPLGTSTKIAWKTPAGTPPTKYYIYSRLASESTIYAIGESTSLQFIANYPFAGANEAQLRYFQVSSVFADGSESFLTLPIGNDDTDGDAISDANETVLGSNPNLVDTDGDGLTDTQEYYLYNTDPTKVDTDGNGVNDLDQVRAALTPATPPTTITVTKRIYSNAQDGYVFSRQGTWALARSTNSSTAFSGTAAEGWGVIAENDASYYQVGQSHLFFDTAVIPANATITGANVGVYAAYYTPYKADNETLTLVTSPLTAAPSSSDANKTGSVELTSARQTVPTEAAPAYVVLPLNATGISTINKTGITAFATRMSYDFDNTTPTGRNLMWLSYSENGNQNQRPYLDVTYTVQGPAIAFAGMAAQTVDVAFPITLVTANIATGTVLQISSSAGTVSPSSLTVTNNSATGNILISGIATSTSITLTTAGGGATTTSASFIVQVPPTTITLTKKFYSNANDGYVFSRQTSWSAARSTNSGYSMSSTADSGWGNITENDGIGYFQNGQSHYFFDTSLISPYADVIGANLGVYGNYNSAYNTNNLKLSVVGSPLFAAATASDANKAGATEYTDTRQSVPNQNSSAYIVFPLNSAGRSAVNKASTTALATRTSYDIDNLTPTGRNLMMMYYSESTDPNQRPYLEVTYTVPAPKIILPAIAAQTLATSFPMTITTANIVDGTSIALTSSAGVITPATVTVSNNAATAMFTIVNVATTSSITITE